jgi:hypothetical protein
MFDCPSNIYSVRPPTTTGVEPVAALAEKDERVDFEVSRI